MTSKKDGNLYYKIAIKFFKSKALAHQPPLTPSSSMHNYYSSNYNGSFDTLCSSGFKFWKGMGQFWGQILHFNKKKSSYTPSSSMVGPWDAESGRTNDESEMIEVCYEWDWVIGKEV